MSVTWHENGQEKRGPSWRELVDQAAREIGFSDPDLLRVRGQDLQILEYFGIKHQNTFSKLTNWLYAEMRPPDEALQKSEIHKELSLLDKCRLFYTTNYDDFIERSFKLHGRPCTSIVTEADMGALPPDPSLNYAEVVKFHGDLRWPEHMVISESDYEERLRLGTAMDRRLWADALGRALLFIGYSFRDSNVSYLFRLVNDEFKRLPSSPTGRRAYITVSDPSDFERELYRARNIEVIAIDGKSQTQSVVELLREIRQ